MAAPKRRPHHSEYGRACVDRIARLMANRELALPGNTQPKRLDHVAN